MGGSRVLAGLLALVACAGARAAIVDTVAFGWQGDYVNGWPLTAGETLASAPTLDVFLGPFCEDSNKTFPVMQEVAELYGSQLTVKVHIFPLPYNLGSFLAAQACTATGLLSSWDQVLPCMEVVYGNLTAIKTFAMNDGTNPQVIDELSRQIAAQLPVSYDALTAELTQGLESGGDSYTIAKADWKYGCSRGVFATPSVFINQVEVFGTGSHAEGQLAGYSVDDWKELLDPIVNNTLAPRRR